MVVINKKSCPHCGQSINEREIAIFSGMVGSLFKVWKYCTAKESYFFTRKEIKHLLTSDGEIARFGDLKYFGFIEHLQKGKFSLNGQKVEQFFLGNRSIPRSVWKNPITGEIRNDRMITINEIPKLKDLLDENKEYIARYGVKESNYRQLNFIK